MDLKIQARPSPSPTRKPEEKPEPDPTKIEVGRTLPKPDFLGFCPSPARPEPDNVRESETHVGPSPNGLLSGPARKSPKKPETLKRRFIFACRHLEVHVY